MGEEQKAGASEGRLVIAVVAGAIVFYACMAAVSELTDWLFLSSSTSADPVSNTYIAAWALGAGLSSAFGVEVAKRVAPNFNRVGLIVLMVAPIVLVAVGVYLNAQVFSVHTLGAVACALAGTVFGLWWTFHES